MFDPGVSGKLPSGPDGDCGGNSRKSKETHRAYIVFSSQGAEKVGTTGGGTREDGVPIRALRSMVQVKKAYAKMIADFTGDLIVVVIKEMAGVPNVRADMLEFERKTAEALRLMDQPMNCHVKP